MWIYDAEMDKLVNREIDFIPALFKIFDEIIVNAADNKVNNDLKKIIKKQISGPRPITNPDQSRN